jgi:hypothetical protein
MCVPARVGDVRPSEFRNDGLKLLLAPLTAPGYRSGNQRPSHLSRGTSFAFASAGAMTLLSKLANKCSGSALTRFAPLSFAPLRCASCRFASMSCASMSCASWAVPSARLGQSRLSGSPKALRAGLASSIATVRLPWFRGLPWPCGSCCSEGPSAQSCRLGISHRVPPGAWWSGPRRRDVGSGTAGAACSRAVDLNGPGAANGQRQRMRFVPGAVPTPAPSHRLR